MNTITTPTYGFALSQRDIDWMFEAANAHNVLLRGALHEALKNTEAFHGVRDVTMDCTDWMKFGKAIAEHSLECPHHGEATERYEFGRHIYSHARGYYLRFTTGC